MEIKDKSIGYFIGRFEKFVTACFVVSSHIKDNEPIKNHIRERALMLLEVVQENIAYTEHHSALSFNGEIVLKNIHRALDEIIGLVHLAKNASIISFQNYKIIVDEAKHVFEEMVGYIEHVRTLVASDIVGRKTSLTYLDPQRQIEQERLTDFDVSVYSQNARIGGPENQTNAFQSGAMQGIHHAIHGSQNRHSVPATSHKEVSQKNDKGHSAIKDNKGHKGQSSQSHHERTDLILSFIKEKGKVSIADIAVKLPGISQKTIQRELNSLIDQGRVVRFGERRWSVYSIGV